LLCDIKTKHSCTGNAQLNSTSAQLRQKQHGEVAEFMIETIATAGNDDERRRTKSSGVTECQLGVTGVFVARESQHIRAEGFDGSECGGVD
jgi:hypothetical protein